MGYVRFKTTVAMYCVILFISIILEIVFPDSFSIYFWPQLFIFIFQIGLRLYIVRKHQIQECSTSPGSSQLGSAVGASGVATAPCVKWHDMFTDTTKYLTVTVISTEEITGPYSVISHLGLQHFL